jgi:hypothetical protein
MTRTFHYARWPALEDWLRLGWLVVDDFRDIYHGQFSVLVEWKCACALVTPKQK